MSEAKFVDVPKMDSSTILSDELMKRFEIYQNATDFISTKIEMPERIFVSEYFTSAIKMISHLGIHWNDITTETDEYNVTSIIIKCNKIDEKNTGLTIRIRETGMITTTFDTPDHPRVVEIEQEFVTTTTNFVIPPTTDEYDKYITAYMMFFNTSIFEEPLQRSCDARIYKPSGYWKYVTE
jgi:hypothetical protein